MYNAQAKQSTTQKQQEKSIHCKRESSEAPRHKVRARKFTDHTLLGLLLNTGNFRLDQTVNIRSFVADHCEIGVDRALVLLINRRKGKSQNEVWNKCTLNLTLLLSSP